MDEVTTQPIPVIIVFREPAPDSLERLLDAALTESEPAPLREAS